MSEIEKMYENAGVEPIYPYTKCYPQFNAEKQLELIKILSDREIYINHTEDKYFIFTMNIGGSECSKDFATSLAKYINLIWQDLTEEEKQQIKEILE